jgi:hypothetical protein
VSNLTVRDQSGTDDDWNAYVEFTTPAAARYIGYQTFKLNSSIPSASIVTLRLTVNIKGPLPSVQVWTWRIYDWKKKVWVKLGTNAKAADWVWTLLTFSAPAPFDRYVNSTTRQIRIQLVSNNASDDIDVDYESLRVVTAWKPPLVSSWQIQYAGTIDTSLNVDVYNLDAFETKASVINNLHSRGIHVMCYFSAGSWENWRPDKDQFPPEVLGKTLDGWPDERWLDIRRLDILGPIMKARMDLCQSKGFDGIDPDNIDGYTNDTCFPLTYQDQLEYNIFLANAAHARGLSIGLKNDIDQIPDLVSYFDWQLNEQCFQYKECNTLLPFIAAGKPVFNIEYSLATSQFCPQANAMNFNSLKKHLSLDAYRVPCR